MKKESMGLLLLVFCMVLAELFASSGPSGPASSTALKKMLRIAWTTGPDLPQGFQDSGGGIVDHHLITVDGFCSGQRKGIVNKFGKYPRGFLKKVWALNLKAPRQGWHRLPDFPGTPRQRLSCIVIKNALYCWGGFSYSEPYIYHDGYRLQSVRGHWTWSRLPDLPWGAAGAGICAIGPKIYWMGGADYDRKQFYTNSDRRGKTKRLGARLLVFNTQSKDARWKQLPTCPGTPRWDAALAAVHGKIYVIGGATGADNAAGQTCTVVDNWRYNPERHAWKRLPDTPIASGNFPSGRIVFQNRYILLVGGFQYKNVLNPSGTIRPAFGKVFHHYQHNPYDSDIFVYDTLRNQFGRADPLPLNNNDPLTVLQGSQINLIGGETGGSVINGEYYGHHPDLYLVGKISTVRP